MNHYKNFLYAWLTWAEKNQSCDPLPHETYGWSGATGLCGAGEMYAINVPEASTVPEYLQARLRETKGDNRYPFGRGKYCDFRNTGRLHTQQERLDWVRSEIVDQSTIDWNKPLRLNGGDLRRVELVYYNKHTDTAVVTVYSRGDPFDLIVDGKGKTLMSHQTGTYKSTKGYDHSGYALVVENKPEPMVQTSLIPVYANQAGCENAEVRMTYTDGVPTSVELVDPE